MGNTLFLKKLTWVSKIGPEWNLCKNQLGYSNWKKILGPNKVWFTSLRS